jgi:hypothetical protein
MQVHVFITLTTSTMFHEARSTALDLDTTPSLLLDMLDISPSMTNNLSTEVEARNWFKIYLNSFLGPFALFSNQ